MPSEPRQELPSEPAEPIAEPIPARRRRWIPAAALVLVAAAALAGYRGFHAGGSPASTPSPSVAATPAVTPASPSPTVTASATADGRDAPATLVEAFYAAFAVQDSQKLFSYFVPPTGHDDKELLSLLESGQSLEGIAGGPTLFESNSASGTVVAHAVTATVAGDAATTFTVDETVDYFEAKGVKRVRTVEVVSVDGGYAIAAYRSDATASMYSGFLN